MSKIKVTHNNYTTILPLGNIKNSKNSLVIPYNTNKMTNFYINSFSYGKYIEIIAELLYHIRDIFY
jgi:hypothetical protein